MTHDKDRDSGILALYYLLKPVLIADHYGITVTRTYISGLSFVDVICASVSEMIIAYDQKAVLTHICGKILISADMFSHSVGDLEDSLRSLVGHPLNGVDARCTISGFESDLFFTHVFLLHALSKILSGARK